MLVRLEEIRNLCSVHWQVQANDSKEGDSTKPPEVLSQNLLSFFNC